MTITLHITAKDYDQHIYRDSQRTSKSFAAPPCNRPYGCKTHASLPTRTSLARQLGKVLRQQDQCDLYTLNTKRFDHIKCLLGTLYLSLIHISEPTRQAEISY